jgi:poly(A) polymerase
MEIVKKLKKILGKGDIFQFEKDKDVATIIFYEKDVKYRFDFSYLPIDDIMNDRSLDFYDKEKKIIERLEEDLLQRDFTINAMAIVFDDAVGLGATQTVLFDPSNGLEDLQMGIVRPVAYENIEKDPVRIFRGYRIAQQLDLEIEKDFEEWLKKNKHLIKNSPIERIRDEILKMFDSKNSFVFINHIVEIGLLEEVIPVVGKTKKLKIHLDINKETLLEHSSKTLAYTEKLLDDKGFLAGFLDIEFIKKLGSLAFLTEFSDITMLKLASFFHDIGRIKEDRTTIEKHQKLSEEVFFKEIAKPLSLGEKASKFAGRLIGNHLEVWKLYQLHLEGSLTPKYKNLFWYHNKDIAPHLFILTIADTKATFEDKYHFEKLKEFIIYLQAYYFDVYQKEIVEEPLLSGKEIMEILNIPPSKKIGEIKNKLLEYQLEGKIKTKEEAIKFIKALV